MIERSVHLSSPEEPPPTTYERLEVLEDFWRLLEVGSVNNGETALSGLEDLRDQVNKLLCKVPADVTTSEGLTAYAAELMSGQQLF